MTASPPSPSTPTKEQDKGQERRPLTINQMQIENRPYIDHSGVDETRDLSSSDRKILGLYRENVVGGPFPIKLQIVLKVVEEMNLEHIISWLPHGRSFIINRPRAFEKEIMVQFFKQTKISSFKRQLNLYDFQRITHGEDAGSYYHELFLRGRPLFATQIVRRKIKGTNIRGSNAPRDEPNFYRMPFMGSTKASSTSVTITAEHQPSLPSSQMVSSVSAERDHPLSLMSASLYHGGGHTKNDIGHLSLLQQQGHLNPQHLTRNDIFNMNQDCHLPPPFNTSTRPSASLQDLLALNALHHPQMNWNMAHSPNDLFQQTRSTPTLSQPVSSLLQMRQQLQELPGDQDNRSNIDSNSHSPLASSLLINHLSLPRAAGDMRFDPHYQNPTYQQLEQLRNQQLGQMSYFNLDSFGR